MAYKIYTICTHTHRVAPAKTTDSRMRYEGGILGMQPTELVLFQLLGTNAHKITGLGES